MIIHEFFESVLTTPILQYNLQVGHSVRRLDPINSAVGGLVSPGDGNNVSPALQSAAQTLYYLLDLATFFDLGNAGQWQVALDHMDRLGLIPTSTATEVVDAKVAGFTALSDLVRRPLPAALLLLMRCLAAKASSAKATEYVNLILASTSTSPLKYFYGPPFL